MVDKSFRTLYIRTSPERHRLIKIRAAEEERTISEVINSAIDVYLKAPAGWAPRLKKGKKS